MKKSQQILSSIKNQKKIINMWLQLIVQKEGIKIIQLFKS
uniref:Uncharacterized protein n=1 Tax=Myoviridae sp. ctCo31 TaxID=2825053 RepID=A0A8S5UMD0_9CAUD|nr:MAG TPA: hypothetical protein [Myoviridae sp. ctCo31]